MTQSRFSVPVVYTNLHDHAFRFVSYIRVIIERTQKLY